MWGVAFLCDGAVLSVDSVGKVQLWDPATGTRAKSHFIANADSQSLAVADQEDRQFCGGHSRGHRIPFPAGVRDFQQH